MNMKKLVILGLFKLTIPVLDIGQKLTSKLMDFQLWLLKKMK